MQKVAVLILAAGGSTRMGSIKQLLPWRETTLLGNAINEAKSIKNATIFVVLGANASEIERKTDFDSIELLLNQHWKNGLGSSLAYAVSEIINRTKKYDALLVLLADQPLIDSKYLNTMINLFAESKKNIIATKYLNGVGVPAVFSATYFTALKDLKADFGAKNLLKKYAKDIEYIQSHGKERDVDTLEDYQKIRKEISG